MNNFNRNDRGGDRGGNRYGGRDSGGGGFRGRDGVRPAMHKATCAECGSSCEVPFLPTGDRPIYCSKCFETRRNKDGDSRGSDSRSFGRPNFEEKRPYPATSGGGEKANIELSEKLMEQLNSFHAKLDKIISALEPKTVEPLTPKKRSKKA
ncbi:MAG: hypothetical protein Q8N98_01960 [bacterium]|nr:hypothetical protein [bacterium]